MHDNTWIAAIVIGQMAFVGWMVHIAVSYWHKRTRLRSEERLRVLERFGSGEELAGFLNTAAGEKLLGAFSPQQGYPVRTIAWTTAMGVILLFLGGAFLLLARFFEDIFIIPGMVLSMTGGGVLLSAAISTRLYRRAGLLPPRKPEL